jgi:hypothetical protein
MLERVKEAVMVYQTNPKAIRFVMAAASLLESLLLGKTLGEGISRLCEIAMGSSSNFSTDDSDIGDACLTALMEAKMKDVPTLMEGLVEDDQGGSSGKIPSAFIVPMFMFYKAMGDGAVDEAAYLKAIRENIMAGGDTCCRAIFIGAVMAAAAGSVPESFVEKFSKETMAKIDVAIAGIIDAI